MDESTLRELTFKRGQLKGSITRLRSFFTNFTPDQNILQLKLRLKKFEPCWQQFQELQELFERHDTSEEQVNERESFENNYFTLVSDIETYLGQYGGQTTTSLARTNQDTNGDSLSKVQLPKLNLPMFNGSYDQWLPFYDTFNSLIHQNNSVPNIQKFHYLRSSLTGDAAQVIHSLELSNDNYDVAWSLITERYENKRLIIQTHVKALFELPSITKESFIALRQLVDNVQKHMRALKSLQQPTDCWDTLMIHLITSKLDSITKREWETSIQSSNLPTLADMTKFLIHKCQLLESLNTSKCPPVALGSKSKQFKANDTTVAHVASYKPICFFCKGTHYIFKCDKFLQLSTELRIAETKKLNVCTNCFKSNHTVQQCNSSTCKICGKKHNTLLHIQKDDTSTTDSSTQVTASSQIEVSDTNQTIVANCQNNSQVILSTAIVVITDKLGHSHEARVLLDSGSQSNFMTEKLCSQLNLKATKINIPVIGINQSPLRVTHTAHTTIKSKHNSFRSSLTFLVVPSITQNLPLCKIDSSILKIPQNLKLADPSFNCSSPIDILIGAELFWDLMCVGQIKAGPGLPILQKTQLGWIISGKIHSNSYQKTSNTICNLNIENLENIMSRFWQIEECHSENLFQMNSEETLCENHYVANTTRRDDGHYIVKLPLRNNINQLGSSREQAERRLTAMETRLKHQPELKQEYTRFMQEYEQLGHMELIDDAAEVLDGQICYYLPHHAVVKESSLTTKVRVVFDGSAKTSTGISLNQTLMVGPTVQQDLFSIIMRFRIHKYVLTADIIKMYRQIVVHHDHTNLQRILWRYDPYKPVNTYKLNTVTYGTAAAPFLAIRSLHQLAFDEQKQFPQASQIILQDFYVDDLLTGSNSLQHLQQVRDDLITILRKGGFELNKWNSNDETLLLSNSDNDGHSSILVIDRSYDIKTLGLIWNSKTDNLRYQVLEADLKQRTTKRTILSSISQIFDPLGLLGPVIVKAKIIMQRLWELKLNWDETIPIELHTAWSQYRSQLNLLNQVSIPRNVINDSNASLQIHGFCDASEAAYGACIYIRSTNHLHHSVSLVCSKSRVAPLKKTTLPRLELSAAVLLSKLLKYTLKSLNIKFDSCHLWSDSTIVLSWISGSSGDWKTFVANRVSQIQDLTNIQDWKHVSTHDNPADLVSRGLSPMKLIGCSLWWNGPVWLAQDFQNWPEPLWSFDQTKCQSERRKFTQVFATMSCSQFINRFSTLTRLLRVTAYCLRFASNTRLKLDQRYIGILTTEELTHSLTTLVKMIQQQEFAEDYHELKTTGHVDSTSNVASLAPFLDIQDIIRVGGRLKNASIPYAQKHPMLLPGRHHFTKLLITSEHLKNLHAGPQALLATLRLTFWPLGVKSVIRQVIRQCLICAKVKPVTSQHQMGDLPSNRVNPFRPFTNCGMDFCGPFTTKESHRRGKCAIKTYIVIFVCFSTKAIHLELVTDLTTAAFLGAFKRFIARRGKCANVYSDNATNFVGARNEMIEQNQHKYSFKHFSLKIFILQGGRHVVNL